MKEDALESIFICLGSSSKSNPKTCESLDFCACHIRFENVWD